MGDDLNDSFDNLLFTRIFKNPEWYRKVNSRGIERRFQVFSKVMRHERINASDLLVLRNAIRSNKTYPSTREYLKNYTIKQLIKKQDTTSPKSWGWKEPNTQFFIKDFLSISTELKYIHVIRHGLDMAFSANKKQLHNWGFLYGLQADEHTGPDELATLQLDFWIESTKQIQNLQAKFPNRILILNRSQLIQSPLEKVTELLRFADLEVTESQLKNLAKIPKKQKSDGRYHNHDLSIFASEQIEFVKQAGFEI